MKARVLTKEALREEAEQALTSIREVDEQNIHNQIYSVFLDGEAGTEQFFIDYTFRAEPRHWNTFEIVHGGVAATLLDDCLGVACAIARGEAYITTSSMSLEYLRAMKGRRFRVHAAVTHVGEHMVTGTGSIYDEKGRLCVSCMASYTIHTNKAEGPGRAL